MYNGVEVEMRNFSMNVGDWLWTDSGRKKMMLVLEIRMDGYVRMSDGLWHHPSAMSAVRVREVARERERLETGLREAYRVEMSIERERRGMKADVKDCEAALGMCGGMLPLEAAMAGTAR